MDAKTALKRFLTRAVPEPWLRPLKKTYYALAYKNLEPRDLRDGPVMAHLVGPADHAVDIGANIGYYAKVLSDLVGPSGRVDAFEPVAQTFDILRSNLRRWKRTNVRLFECAVSDGSDPVIMEVPRYSSGGHDFYEAKITPEYRKTSHLYPSVETRSLDRLYPEGAPPLHFIKMDAMGNEWKCVRGAPGLLDRDRPALLMALYSDPNDPRSDGQKIFERLTGEHGYAVYWYDGKRLKAWKPGEISYRYFFLAPPHLDRLEKAGFKADPP